jgi:FHA domain
MELLLTLENGGRAVEDRQRRLRGGRLSIGRGADSDWVLPDPERQLSKHHCVVEQRDGAWFLTDTSANGVFVAGSPDPLGNSGSVRLQDGLRLRLGGYVLAVSLPPDDGPSAPAFTPAAASPPLFDQTWYRGRSLDLPGIPSRPRRPSPGRTTPRRITWRSTCHAGRPSTTSRTMPAPCRRPGPGSTSTRLAQCCRIRTHSRMPALRRPRRMRHQKIPHLP